MKPCRNWQLFSVKVLRNESKILGSNLKGDLNRIEMKSNECETLWCWNNDWNADRYDNNNHSCLSQLPSPVHLRLTRNIVSLLSADGITGPFVTNLTRVADALTEPNFRPCLEATLFQFFHTVFTTHSSSTPYESRSDEASNSDLLQTSFRSLRVVTDAVDRLVRLNSLHQLKEHPDDPVDTTALVLAHCSMNDDFLCCLPYWWQPWI